MEHLDKKAFIEKIFDFENEKEWKYRGALPAIIDFYADWCAPCKMVAPILEKVSEEYEGKLHVFKINTDKEQELAGAFGIMSIPSLLFIPASGQPQMALGALDRRSFDRAITEVLGVKKEEPQPKA